ncbi:AAA family ATPase [Kribbella sp. NPDC026596]|uniref:AAA family ATPase n=1 Tax=Kribbella sp. NPDC026596 TaxID=3155122 RepID=UPI0033C100A7
MSEVLLLTGAPGSGKTTVAALVAAAAARPPHALDTSRLDAASTAEAVRETVRSGRVRL